MPNGELTTKQRLFVEAYLANPNATDAAIKAGYSKKTARSQGQRLLTKVDIAKMVETRVDSAAMTANEVLQELSEIAKCDWQDFVEIRRDRHGDVIDATLKLSDKIKALELIGKHHKLFTEKHELTGKDGGAIVVATRVIEPE
jgi:phage terminase small subunit